MFDFKNIEFGDSDAQTEVAYTPDLLLRGFLDPTNMVDCALNRRSFLFLGTKGSGKSALSEHLKLLSESNDEFIVNSILLNEFPYKLFSKIVKGDAENESKFHIAWRFLLLLYILYSLDNDHECQHTKVDEWTDAVNQFRNKGLFPIKNVSDLVRKTSKWTFSFDLKIIQASSGSGEVAQDDVNTVSEYLKTLLCSVTSSKRHYLVIDGLDETLTNRNEQQKSVVALLSQAKEINNWCSRNKIPFKIIVLCRTDIYDKLSDPNKNKLKQDFAFVIQWFDESETEDDKRSALIRLANLRCQLTYNEVSDMFDTFFPKTYEDKPIRKALLDYTRHTPRDFLQLLKKIQMSCQGSKVTRADITSGLKKYSMDYFKDEIKDELAGYEAPENVELIFQLLSQFKQRDFKYSDVVDHIHKSSAYVNVNWMEAFTLLFNCSAIGHRVGKDNFIYMKYRNPSMTFTTDNVIMIHRGLWKALSY